jgi:dTDP-4-amino-4,6-dideoxygalactose transaminase
MSPRTKAIVAVHYAGVGCEMEAILDLAARHGVAVVEDNAHGLLGRYRGRPRDVAPLATLSFTRRRTSLCGEGGALLINDPSLIERRRLSERERTAVGSSAGKSTAHGSTWDRAASCRNAAAFLFGQRGGTHSRASTWHLGITTRTTSRLACGCVSDYQRRRRTASTLRTSFTCSRHRSNTGALHGPPQQPRRALVFHYLPLHLSDMGRRFGGRRGIACHRGHQRSPTRLPIYYHRPSSISRGLSERFSSGASTRRSGLGEKACT